MPQITKLIPADQAWAVIAFLESQGGTVDVTAADLSAAPAASSAPPAAAAALAGGSTDPKAIIKAAGCPGCHMLDGQGATLGPDLTHVGARRDAASLRQKITDPGSSIAKGYENFAGVMPKDFGTRMSPAQLDALVQYFAGRK